VGACLLSFGELLVMMMLVMMILCISYDVDRLIFINTNTANCELAIDPNRGVSDLKLFEWE